MDLGFDEEEIMINEDELDDLRTGYAEWIETCAVANMNGITSPMINCHHDTVNDQPADTVNDSSLPCPTNPAIDDCLSCVRENMHENMAKDLANDSLRSFAAFKQSAKDEANENVVIEIQGGGSSKSGSESGGIHDDSIIHAKGIRKNNGKRSRKVTSDHSVKNDREHGSGNIRRVYSLSEVLND